MKSWRKILNNLLHSLFGKDPKRIDWAKYKAHYFIIIYYTCLCWFVMDEYKITGRYLDLELLFIAYGLLLFWPIVLLAFAKILNLGERLGYCLCLTISMGLLILSRCPNLFML